MLGEVSTEFPALFRMWADEGPIHGWSLLRDLVEEGKMACVTYGPHRYCLRPVLRDPTARNH